MTEVPREGRPPQLDLVGSLLSAAGLGLIVYSVLQSNSWGWITPKNSPVEPFGFSLTLFVIGAGVLLLLAFSRWERRREAHELDPLVRLDQLKIPPLRAGLAMFCAQNLILMGIFFTIPLYLQVVQGYDAFETGLRMLPVSVTLFLTSALGPVFERRFGARSVVRAGLAVLLVACVALLTLIDHEIDTVGFLVTMAVLGVGMGLLASQLGNVVQSSVGPEERSEAGGLQYTAQQLGAALGTALMGAVVIGSMATTLGRAVDDDPRVSDAVAEQVGIQLAAGVSFVAVPTVEAAVTDAGVPISEGDAIVENYADSQLQALKLGLLLAAFVVAAAFFGTKRLPDRPAPLEN